MALEGEGGGGAGGEELKHGKMWRWKYLATLSTVNSCDCFIWVKGF